MLPGSHDIRLEELRIGNPQEFRAAIRRIRRKFPILAAREEYREHDRALMKARLPVIYALVFRGQTAEYVDRKTGKPLLLPSALRPNARPAWVHRGSPAIWHERPLGQDLDAEKELLTANDVAQITAFRRGLTAYGLELLRVGAEQKWGARIEAWSQQGVPWKECSTGLLCTRA